MAKVLTMLDLLRHVRDGAPLPQKVSSLERMAEALEQGLVEVERHPLLGIVGYRLTANGRIRLGMIGEPHAKAEPRDGATRIDVPALRVALATLQAHEKLLIAAVGHVTPMHVGIASSDFAEGAEGEAMLKEIIGEVAADAFAEVYQALALSSKTSGGRDEQQAEVPLAARRSRRHRQGVERSAGCRHAYVR